MRKLFEGSMGLANEWLTHGIKIAVCSAHASMVSHAVPDFYSFAIGRNEKKRLKKQFDMKSILWPT